MVDQSSLSDPLPIGQCATLACLLEVSAPKPGNVHRSADFEDVTFIDFVASATAISPALEGAQHTGVGTAVLEAIRATRRLVATNTNLGSVLLLAPLAAVPRSEPLYDGLPRVLASLDQYDAAAVYEAIRLAQPGGMGTVEQMDVAGDAPSGLLPAMRAAAERDMVARQYVTGFDTVFDAALPWLSDGVRLGWRLTDAIIVTQLRLMSQFPDSLITRKCGLATAEEASRRAAQALQAGEPGEPAFFAALSDLDFWLRSDHHRRNPGTTADLIAAALFAGLREGTLRPPF